MLNTPERADVKHDENLPIKAFWKDKGTVVIETKDDYPVLIRHDQVSSFKDVVKIVYRSIVPGVKSALDA